MLRRGAPVFIALVAIALLLSYVIYARSVTSELGMLSARSSFIYGRIYTLFADSTAASTESALFELVKQVRDLEVPVILTDSLGEPQSCMNLPFCDPLDSDKARNKAIDFDRRTTPVQTFGGMLVHYGDSRMVRLLRVTPYIQGGVLALLLLAGFVLLRERMRAQRDRLWAGMARESAHQIGTPLSSLNGWLELLSDREADDVSQRALGHMRADLDRLERVAHRFERIGRPARREPVDIAALAMHVAEYFRARVPTLAHRVQISCTLPEGAATVKGDAVLLEWALEAIVKNAIDAVAGREGRIQIEVEHTPEGGVTVRVADNGPGVNREIRSLIFLPGFSTKERGWGVGLALARRIVQENHGGELVLVPADSGAVFELKLP